ncbi:MAG: hypothetical protein QM497_03135 [Sulfurimonas sp.]
MTFEQQWTEYDYNPFILFNNKGKVVSLNSEAQFLLGATTPKEIFELAQAYANVTFGFKTTFLDLEFGRYKIFGLTVGYENEEHIGIKFYQSPSFKLKKPKPDGELTNIFSIVDLCISTNSMSSDIQYTKLYDPTIPEIIINTNKLIKILNKMYACVQENEKISTEIFYRVGEHVKFEEKKYSIFSIAINAKNIDKAKSNELKLLAESSNFYIDIKKVLTLNIPMITA